MRKNFRKRKWIRENFGERKSLVKILERESDCKKFREENEWEKIWDREGDRKKIFLRVKTLERDSECEKVLERESERENYLRGKVIERKF